MIARLRRYLPDGKWAVIAPPYFWMLLFFAVAVTASSDRAASNLQT